ncbi:MAG TPA: V-type ATP synthase subunit D [Lachnospiraceae bacterium]|nr:V-type ATP synthase subunit D [Lachnospiraceae bacterium]
MNVSTVPTKGNLMSLQNSLKLAKQGYELMDKKRNILITELTGLISEAKSIQSEIDMTFTKAYEALQVANIELGISYVQEIAKAMPVEDSIVIKTRSVMGTEIPRVEMQNIDTKPTYAFYSTRYSLDKAREAFQKVKELTVRLSAVENSAYRLAANIRKTQKRANALNNITIPTYTALCKNIQAALEEKEREEFTRLKVIKRNKQKEA